MTRVRFLALVVALHGSFVLYPAVPSGYYAQTEGLSGKALKTSLYTSIQGHTVLTYTDLWTAFRSTDVRPDGRVWDVYSNTTSYEFGVDQDSGFFGGSEGQVYNREHSFPNSWFGGDKGSAMYTDLFHLYPADKWVNAKRGNMPFGNVQAVTGNSANHYCEWGTSTESGSSLLVFEPADELKGDFARTYFYMVTRYEEQVGSWTQYANTEMLSGDRYPALRAWAIKVLLAWHKLDPVSEKERNRNEVIYRDFQHNRNPFIDLPQLADYVWGDSTAFAFHPGRYGLEAGLKSESLRTRFEAWGEQGQLCVSAPAGSMVRVYDVLGRLLAGKRTFGQVDFFSVKGNRIVIVSVGNQRLNVKMY